RLGDVLARDLRVADGPDAPAARALVEQVAEHRRAVEPRAAQPVDRAVAPDERGRVAVGEQRVVGDRALGHEDLAAAEVMATPRRRGTPPWAGCAPGLRRRRGRA